MLPSLANLALDTGVKRRLSLPKPEKRARTRFSVQSNLLDQLLRLRTRAAKQEITLEFFYVPGKEAVAKFDLTFFFEDGQLKRINLMERDATKKPCVQCTVKDHVLHLGSLFHALSDVEREGCVFEFVEETPTTDGYLFGGGDADRERRLEESVNRNKGEGAILLGAIVEVAAGLELKRVELTDAAEFYDPYTAPYFDLGVTNFLRMTRGFGQYEKAGFFEDRGEGDEPVSDEAHARYAQRVLNIQHYRLTTPVNRLKAEDFDKNVEKVMEMLAILRSSSTYRSMSLQGILLMCLEEANKWTRPKNLSSVKELREQWSDFMFFAHHELNLVATRIVAETENILVDAHSAEKRLWYDDGKVFHNVVALEKNSSGGSVPTVTTEVLPQHYQFFA